MKNDSEGKGNESRYSSRPGTDVENIAGAWRAYLRSSEENQDALLRALDPVIVTAVARQNRRRLDHALCEDVVQEVRLELVPQGFLLSSAHLREVSAAAEKNNWSEPDAVLVAQTITNLIYMVARWEVSSFLRRETRFQTRQQAWFASGDAGAEAADEAESESQTEQLFRENVLRAALRHHGYSEQDGRLIQSYFAGHLTQAALGQALGFQQAAVSKRLTILRQWMVRASRRNGGPSLGA